MMRLWSLLIIIAFGTLFYFHLSRGLRAMHPSRSARNFDDRLNKTQTPCLKYFSENSKKKNVDEIGLLFFYTS